MPTRLSRLKSRSDGSGLWDGLGLRPLGAVLGVEFEDDLPFPLAVPSSMQAGVDGSELHMGLNEIRPISDEFFKTLSRLLEPSQVCIEGAYLK